MKIVQLIPCPIEHRMVALFDVDGKRVAYDILFWALREHGSITGVVLKDDTLIHCDVQSDFIRYFKG